MKSETFVVKVGQEVGLKVGQNREKNVFIRQQKRATHFVCVALVIVYS